LRDHMDQSEPSPAMGPIVPGPTRAWVSRSGRRLGR
jgi:hypothetical protein